MINVSFYLLTPKAKNQSQVYASISEDRERLRFPTGKKFLTEYCNIRKKKGGKELIKRNTPFYFEYNQILDDTRNSLMKIDMELERKKEPYTLTDIRDSFYLETGKIKIENITFKRAFNHFIETKKGDWTLGTLKKVNGTLNHLIEFEKINGPIQLDKIDLDFWNSFRDNYFVKTKQASNPTTNKILQVFRQFLRFCIKKEYVRQNIDFDEFNYLKSKEGLKIALNENEVNKLAELDLIPRLAKVRDLFLLEVLTGQRFSDMHKLLDRNNISETSITITQQKTGETIKVPLHPKLKTHLTKILNSYPEGIPEISNQKFNEYLKEICKAAEFNKKHSWEIKIGTELIKKTDHRYNLVTSHTGRRTFCTLSLKSKIHHETIMKITGHRKYEQFRAYLGLDEEHLNEAYKNY